MKQRALYTVVLESEPYGRERFRYDSLASALAGIRRLYREVRRLEDGVERVIGLLVNEDPEESDE